MDAALDFKRDIKRDSFRLDDIVVVPTRDLLLVSKREYTLEPLVMDLLCILAERPGDVMMREELINRLWDCDHGGDENLTRAISMLRKTLREANKNKDYIETIPKRGYRLTHPVSEPKPSDTQLRLHTNTGYTANKGSLFPALIVALIISVPIFIIAAIST